MERGALARAGFSECERAAREGESCEGAGAVRHNAPLAPVQPPGDHEMDDEPEIVVETNGDALADAAKRGHAMSKNRRQRRVRGAQKRWPGREDLFEHLAEDAALQSFNVNDDIGQFGHALAISGQRAAKSASFLSTIICEV